MEHTHSVLQRDPSVLANYGQEGSGCHDRASAAHRASRDEWKAARGVAREFLCTLSVVSLRPLHGAGVVDSDNVKKNARAIRPLEQSR